MIRKYAVALAGVVVAALAVAPSAWAQSKGLAAFSQAEMTNEWRVMDTKEMEQAWKDAGYDFVWTDAKSDPAKQLADVEDLLAQKPDVLIVAPIEYEALAPVPGLAAAAKVPLIVVDRNLPGKAGTNGWISVITTGHSRGEGRRRPAAGQEGCGRRQMAAHHRQCRCLPGHRSGQGHGAGLRRLPRHQASLELR